MSSQILSRRAFVAGIAALTNPAVWSCSLQAETRSDHPLETATRKEIRDSAESTIESTTKQLASDPKDSAALSKRGDSYFFLSRFKESVADYDAMLKLDPALDASHWRRGIALFYAERYDDAAKQFERYHSFDNVDRENGIWRFLCQTKSIGLEKARASLLKYEKDDREPFPDVFKLFAGTIEADEIGRRIDAAKISESERESRRFYADLYIGLNHAVQDRPEQALASLRKATQNAWPRTAGYGPRWMWHVGRVHWERLDAKR